MHVGVILLVPERWPEPFRIPHACGGDPRAEHTHQRMHKYSPCMWG